MNNLDHLVYAVPALPEGIKFIKESFGVDPMIGGKHKMWGTHNALIGLGSSYFEIISIDSSLPAPALRPFGVDRKDLPKLTTWALRTTNLEQTIEQVRKAGCAFGDAKEFSRETPEGITLRWKLAFPEEDFHDGLIPFLIDWGQTPHPSKKAPPGCKLIALKGEHPEPEKIGPILFAMGTSMNIEKAMNPQLIAYLSTPNGEIFLS